MFHAWVVRIGASVALLGALFVGTSALWPVDEPVTAAGVAATDEPPADEPAPWRDALLLAGAICLVAGVGLVVLAWLAGRAPPA